MTLGVSTTILSDEIFGVEGEFGYTPRFFERSGGTFIARSHVLTLMGSVVAAVPRRVTRDSLRPYVVGGVGLIRLSIDDVAGALPVRDNALGLNVGGGAIGRLTSRTSVQFEVRHFRTVGREEDVAFTSPSLSFWRATAGISLLGSLF